MLRTEALFIEKERIPSEDEQFEEYIDIYNLNPENVLYMGDDIPDYPVMKKVGLASCPKDAVPEIQDIYNKVEVLCNDKSLSRNMTIYLLHTFSARRLKEIGSFFKIGDSGVSEASRRFSMALEKTRKLRKQVERLRNQLDM